MNRKKYVGKNKRNKNTEIAVSKLAESYQFLKEPEGFNLLNLRVLTC